MMNTATVWGIGLCINIQKPKLKQRLYKKIIKIIRKYGLPHTDTPAYVEQQKKPYIL